MHTNALGVGAELTPACTAVTTAAANNVALYADKVTNVDAVDAGAGGLVDDETALTGAAGTEVLAVVVVVVVGKVRGHGPKPSRSREYGR